MFTRECAYSNGFYNDFFFEFSLHIPIYDFSFIVVHSQYGTKKLAKHITTLSHGKILELMILLRNGIILTQSVESILVQVSYTVLLDHKNF